MNICNRWCLHLSSYSHTTGVWNMKNVTWKINTTQSFSNSNPTPMSYSYSTNKLFMYIYTQVPLSCFVAWYARHVNKLIPFILYKWAVLCIMVRFVISCLAISSLIEYHSSLCVQLISYSDLEPMVICILMSNQCVLFLPTLLSSVLIYGPVAVFMITLFSTWLLYQ